jgi:hypothetical protein
MAVEGRKRGQQTDSAWCQVNYVARFGACNLDTDNDATDYPGAIRGR